MQKKKSLYKVLLEFRVERDFFQLAGRDGESLPGKPRIYKDLKNNMWCGHKEVGRRHLKKTKTEKHRIDPENRDHCIFILMCGPWGLLESRPRPDYQGPRSMDFIWWTGRQLVFLRTVHITALQRVLYSSTGWRCDKQNLSKRAEEKCSRPQLRYQLWE